jgi:hypothetical protein
MDFEAVQVFGDSNWVRTINAPLAIIVDQGGNFLSAALFFSALGQCRRPG